jgi:fructose-specific phosphotransferase system IIA component
MEAMIQEFLDPACIELSLKARRKPALIAEMVEVVCRAGGIDHPDELHRQILERESMGSTGIGSGIAIPHCLTPLVDITRIAFCRSVSGVRFDAVDKKPVSLFFLLVGPKNSQSRHLKILSRLARYLHDPGFHRKLLEASSAEDVMAAFRDKESQ